MTTASKPSVNIFAPDEPPLVTEEAIEDDKLVVILAELDAMSHRLRALPKPGRETPEEVELHRSFDALYEAFATTMDAAWAMRRTFVHGPADVGGRRDHLARVDAELWAADHPKAAGPPDAGCECKGCDGDRRMLLLGDLPARAASTPYGLSGRDEATLHSLFADRRPEEHPKLAGEPSEREEARSDRGYTYTVPMGLDAGTCSDVDEMVERARDWGC